MIQEAAATAVVILNYNGLDDTLKCLASLGARSDRDRLTIVVDNGSKEDPSRIASEFPWVIFIRRDVNGGWAGGNNTGIKEALRRGARRVILLNNDTVVAEDLVERMTLADTVNGGYGVIGPVIRYIEAPDKVMVEACLYNRPGYDGFFQDKAVTEAKNDPPLVEGTDIVNGCCMMIKREVIEKIGLFDERFFLLCEESDYSLRTIEAGWKCGVLAESLVRHKGGAAFERSGESLKSYYDPRNMWLLLCKHSGKFSLGRKFWPSVVQYVKTTHHMYCDAVERAERVSAGRIVEGIADALRGAYGPKPEKRAFVADMVVGMFMSVLYGMYRIKLAVVGKRGTRGEGRGMRDE
jgi:GT2 family glycosyltransferase